VNEATLFILFIFKCLLKSTSFSGAAIIWIFHFVKNKFYSQVNRKKGSKHAIS